MEFDAQYALYRQKAEDRLKTLADAYLPARESGVCQAAHYSLLAGGKRVRAVLVLAACDLLRGDSAGAVDCAAAVEMLHCYSLIHDDLPCMDNDDYRRGRPSCHKAFGEATALLAGDALLTAAFEAISGAPLSAEARVQCAARLSRAAGGRGMVLGQELDLAFEEKKAAEADLRLIHRNKTGALINAAVQMGVAAADGSSQDAAALEAYAYDLGLVFQIVDDVLDVTSTAEELGKPIGSDADNGKTTYVTLYGAQAAMELAAQITTEACRRLTERYGASATFLTALAESLLVRKN